MSATAPQAAGALVDRRPALVHQPWTTDWFGRGGGEAATARAAELAAIFGLPPSMPSLAAVAEALAARPLDASWVSRLHGRGARDVPADALVVVAGQQPTLLGGAALVAHKACTALALARHLEHAWQRRVVPVFLLATEDHDTFEVDHVDFFDPRSASLRRVRSPLTPAHDRLMESMLDEPSYSDSCEAFANAFGWPAQAEVGPERSLGADASRAGGDPASVFEALRFTKSFSAHVEGLLHAVFGHLGLLVVRSHELTACVPGVMEAALVRRAELAALLKGGAEALRHAGLPASFDAADPRPLLLESRSQRRRRLAPDDTGALARLRADPAPFSPHAALRPVIQGLALPVVAQVGGPSELRYLGQARGLHALLGGKAPVLVPRLEATSVSRNLLRAAGGDLAELSLPGTAPAAGSDGAAANRRPASAPAGVSGSSDAEGLEVREGELLEAARAFAQAALTLEPGKAAAAERWLRRVEHGARRLADTPLWRGRVRQDARSALRPRGRPQDTVLAWLPDALHHARPREWAEHIVSLCRPLDPPAHVLHVPPGDVRDG